MARFLKFFAVFLVLLFAAVSVTLQGLKPRLSEVIRDLINDSVEAKVDYGSVDISLLRSFPSVRVAFRDLSVTEKGGTDHDTLATVDRFAVAFNVLSILSGEMKVSSVDIDRPYITLLKDADGKGNWNIFPASPETRAKKDSASYALDLRDLRVRNGYISFADSTNGSSIILKGLQHRLQGRLSGRASSVVTENTIDSISVTMGGISWLQKVGATFEAEIDADFENRKFILKENRLGLNDLDMVFNGAVSLLDDAVNTDIDFNAEKAALKEVLSLLPAFYRHDYAALDASGKVKLKGHIKGLYRKEQLPAFRLGIEVSEGGFGYKGVPVRAENVVFNASVTNPGGSADQTMITVPRLELAIDGKPFLMSFSLHTPVSDPYIDAAAEGTLDLGDLQKIYHTGDLRLSGELVSNLAVKGSFSAFTDGRSSRKGTEAYGYLLAKNIIVSSDRFTPDINVVSAQMNFSPGYADIVDCRIKAGKSDFSVQGKLENYIPFLLQKEELKGRAEVRSAYVQLDEFRNMEEEKAPLLLPEAVSIRIDGKFDRVAMGEAKFANARGRLVLEDETLTFDNINAEALGGNVTVNGYYTTKGGITDTDFSITAADMNVTQSWQSLEILKKVAPVAEYAKGDVSADLSLHSRLDEKLQPVPETISGKGRVETGGLLVEGFPPVRKLAAVLDVDALDTLRIPEAVLDFAIEDGQVTTSPFSLEINDITIKASGVTGFDKSLDWKIGLVVPKKYFGTKGIKTLTGLLSKLPLKSIGVTLPDTVLVDAAMTGSIDNPKIGLDMARTAKRITSGITDSLEETLTDKLKGSLFPKTGKDSAGVKGVLQKTAESLLFPDRKSNKDTSETSVKEKPKKKVTIPSLIEKILDSPEESEQEVSKETDGTLSEKNAEDSLQAEVPADSAAAGGAGDSAKAQKSLLDFFR